MRIVAQKAESAKIRILNKKDPIPRVKRKQKDVPESFVPGSLNSDRKFDDMLGDVLGDLNIPLPSLREMAKREDIEKMNEDRVMQFY